MKIFVIFIICILSSNVCAYEYLKVYESTEVKCTRLLCTHKDGAELTGLVRWLTDGEIEREEVYIDGKYSFSLTYKIVSSRDSLLKSYGGPGKIDEFKSYKYKRDYRSMEPTSTHGVTQ